MEIQGKIIKALDVRSGTTERGNWMSQEFVLEVTHRSGWKTHMVFTVVGQDRLQRFAIKEGQHVNVSFDIDAHEYNGRWFNSVRAFDVRQRSADADSPQANTEEKSQGIVDDNPFGADSEEKLPFD